MKTIIAKCPLIVDFFGCQKNNIYNLKSVIDIYDLIEIYTKKTVDNHPIVINDNNNLIINTIHIFLEYTKINNYKLYIDIARNIPKGLNSDISDALGIIKALDMYFKIGLTDEDIIKICTNVDEKLLPYTKLLNKHSLEKDDFNLIVMNDDKTLINLNNIKEKLEQYKAKLISLSQENNYVLSFRDHHERFKIICELRERDKIKTLTCHNCQGFVINRKYR